MKRVRRLMLFAGGLALPLGALFAAGCSIDVMAWHHEGYATIQWTIDGYTDPIVCARLGADRVEIRTIDAWGDTRDVTTPWCDAFTETIVLDSGTYYAELTMIDSWGQAVSSTLGTPPFRVVHNGLTVAAVDFPSSGVIPWRASSASPQVRAK